MPDPKSSGQEGKTPLDFFYRDRIFADAKALLQYKQKPLEEIKTSCLVGIDANVLLLPYQLNSVSLDEIVKVYTRLNRDKRLIFPAQALREFFSHRAEKLGAIVQHLRDEASKLTPPLRSKIGILDGDPSFQAAKNIAEKIKKLNKELQSKLNDISDLLSLQVGNDPVSVAYSAFPDAVRELKIESSQQGAFVDGLNWRYAHKVPPGYMDAKSPTGGIGDLVIWKTLLEEGKNQKKDMIFVTAEEKQDWWVRNHGAFQPRVELLEEYRAFTGGNTIQIIPLSNVLKLFEVQEDVLIAVRDVEEANTIVANLNRVAMSAAEPRSYSFRVQPDPKQLANLREKLIGQLEQTELEIRKWETGVGWLPQDQTGLAVRELRERRSQLKANIDYVDQQLSLTAARSDDNSVSQ
jgi:hypothetical protein